ncbi:MAG: HAD-IC family P-type ATPase, partial [Acidobacteriaceae bacterium]|nr:HAD-IC family P-type ATPase [Acidobacteriaceae bacterium]
MTVTDPVCGMQVDAEAAPASTEYQGKTFYFCYTGCKQKFDAEPARYLAPKSAMGFVQLDALAPAKEPPPSVRPNRSTGPESLIEYTCPMDPEIRQMGPGVCPKCGMALEPVAGTGQEPNPELADMRRRFWISVTLTLPLVAFMFMGGLAGWIQFLLSTPVVVWAGAPFFQRGWASVTNRRLNMFTLIALGTGIAYASSLVALLRPGLMPTYFEPAAVIITLVLLGQILELRARARTASALKSLLELTPKNARLIVDDDEHEIPVDQIRPGDRLRVRPGEKVPVDGAVLEGSTTINESMITGEPMPVDKASGDTVAAGTVNTTGSFIMQAERVGSETLLSQIVRLVGEAQRTRAPVQRVADIVAGYFVPAVVVCAVVTFIAWLLLGPEPRMANAFVSAVSVLIIACPCALGLATPMSVMVGTGRGARSGVLIRNAEALETLQKADILIVDKTGTLTEGKPAVTQVQANATSSESDVLRLAA